MTLKVGELYKARNGKAVKIIDNIMGGCLIGDIGDGSRVVYRESGKPFAAGWDDWSIDGLSGPATDPDNHWSRLNAVEAQLRDVHRQLRNIRGIQSGMLADMAAKLGEIVERLDGTERRIVELRERAIRHLQDQATRNDTMNERMDDIATFVPTVERRLASLETAKAWTDTASVMAKVEQVERDTSERLDRFAIEISGNAERSQIAGISLAKRIASQGTAISTHAESLARIEDMLTAEKSFDLLGRIGKLESQTYEQQKFISAMTERGPIDLNTGKATVPPPNPCSEPSCMVCHPPKRVIKGGWLNVYRDGSGYRLDDKPCSDKRAVDGFTPSGERIACIQIPDFTEGEGL
jgi:hypothetical protein